MKANAHSLRGRYELYAAGRKRIFRRTRRVLLRQNSLLLPWVYYGYSVHLCSPAIGGEHSYPNPVIILLADANLRRLKISLK